MDLLINTVENITTVTCAGRITFGEGSTMFRDTIQDLVAKKRLRIIIDLGNVSYIDSTGICELTCAWTTVANAGGKMVLAHLTKRVQDLLQIVRLYTVFDVFDTADEAARYLLKNMPKK